MKKDNERYIDLSDIKNEEIDKTVSFTDLMTRSDRKRREKERKENIEELISSNVQSDDIEEMIDERKRSTTDLSNDLKKVKTELKQTNQDEEINKTQIFEFTRQMKYNLEENTEENIKMKKKGISPLNIIGEVNLLCIGYYIYSLMFTSLQNEQSNYFIEGGLVVLLVFLFGISIITNKKVSKVFNVLNILAIILFIAFNTYTFIK